MASQEESGSDRKRKFSLYTPVRNRDIAHIYETQVTHSWMLDYTTTIDERKKMLAVLETNFRLEYPEYDPELISKEIEEDNARYLEKRIQKYQRFIDTSYSEGLYSKIEKIIDMSSTVPDHTFYLGSNQTQRLYCCKYGFLDFLYPIDCFPQPVEKDIVVLYNGSPTAIHIVIKNSPIITLYNLKHSLQDTPNEYLYGVVLTGPESMMSERETRVIFQIKNVSRIEARMPFSPE